MFEIRHYVTASGKDVMAKWLRDLDDMQAKVAITARLNRLRDGHFGDFHSVGDGVSELRIDKGPGYRIYFAQHGKEVIILLCAGTKRTQSRGKVSDIDQAKAYWKNWQKR